MIDITKLIRKKRQARQCFVRISDDLMVAIINFFDKETKIGEILEYIKKDIVIITSGGNIEMIPFSYISDIFPVLDNWDEVKFDKHYKKELEDNPVGFMFDVVNLVEVLQQSKNEIYKAQQIYREEFEKLFRKFCEIRDEDKKPLWTTSEQKQKEGETNA